MYQTPLMIMSSGPICCLFWKKIHIIYLGMSSPMAYKWVWLKPPEYLWAVFSIFIMWGTPYIWASTHHIFVKHRIIFVRCGVTGGSDEQGCLPISGRGYAAPWWCHIDIVQRLSELGPDSWSLVLCTGVNVAATLAPSHSKLKSQLTQVELSWLPSRLQWLQVNLMLWTPQRCAESFTAQKKQFLEFWWTMTWAPDTWVTSVTFPWFFAKPLQMKLEPKKYPAVQNVLWSRLELT